MSSQNVGKLRLWLGFCLAVFTASQAQANATVTALVSHDEIGREVEFSASLSKKGATSVSGIISSLGISIRAEGKQDTNETGTYTVKNSYFSCPSGYTLDGNQCVRSTLEERAPSYNTGYECPSGYTRNGSRCNRTVVETKQPVTTTEYKIYHCASRRPHVMSIGWDASEKKCLVMTQHRNAQGIPTGNIVTHRDDPASSAWEDNLDKIVSHVYWYAGESIDHHDCGASSWTYRSGRCERSTTETINATSYSIPYCPNGWSLVNDSVCQRGSTSETSATYNADIVASVGYGDLPRGTYVLYGWVEGSGVYDELHLTAMDYDNRAPTITISLSGRTDLSEPIIVTVTDGGTQSSLETFSLSGGPRDETVNVDLSHVSTSGNKRTYHAKPTAIIPSITSDSAYVIRATAKDLRNNVAAEQKTFNYLPDTIGLASGGTLAVPAIPHSFRRQSGHHGILGAVVSSPSGTVNGSHPVYATVSSTQLPIEINGVRVRPDELVQVSSSYNFSGSSGQINLPIAPTGNDIGSVTVQLVTPAPGGDIVEFQVQSWRTEGTLESDRWTVDQLREGASVSARAQAGSMCQYTTNKNDAQTSDVYDNPTCHIVWRSAPDELVVDSSGSLSGQIVSAGQHTLGYDIYVVDSDGSTAQIGSATRSIQVDSIYGQYSFAPNRDVSEVALALEYFDITLEQTEGISCHLTGSEQEAKSYAQSNAFSDVACHLEWEQVPNGLSINNGGQVPFLEGTLTEPGAHTASWTVSAYSRGGRKVTLSEGSYQIEPNDTVTDDIPIKSEGELTSGGVLSVPASTHAFTRPTGEGALLSEPLTSSGGTLSGKHDIYVVALPGGEIPITVAGTALVPGEITKVRSGFDFDASGGRIDLPLAVSENNVVGQTRLRVATSDPNAQQLEFPVRSWRGGIGLQGSSWSVDQLREQVIISAESTSGTRCSITSSQSVAQASDVFDDPVCQISWSAPPGEIEEKNASSNPVLTYLTGQAIETGNHSISVDLYLVDHDGSRIRLDSASRTLSVEPIYGQYSFAPNRDVSEVTLALEYVDITLTQVAGQPCTLTGSETQARSDGATTAASDVTCHLEWQSVPEDLIETAGGEAPFLEGTMQSEGVHETTWTVSAYSSQGTKVTLADESYQIAVSRVIDDNVQARFTADLATGGRTLSVPALDQSFNRLSGAEALFSAPLQAQGTTLTGKHDIFVAVVPGNDFPVRVHGQVINPGEVIKLISQYDFDEESGQINISASPAIDGATGSALLRVSTSNPYAEQMEVTVQSWDATVSIDGNSWNVRQLFDPVEITASGSAETLCQLSTYQEMAQYSDIYTNPICLVSWTGYPDELQQLPGLFQAMPFGDLYGEAVTVGDHTVGIDVHLVNPDGQRFKIDERERTLRVTDVSESVSVEAVLSSEEVTQAFDSLDVLMNQTLGTTCLLTNSKDDVLAFVEDHGNFGDTIGCHLEWNSVPDGLEQVRTEPPELSGSLNESGSQELSWTISAYSKQTGKRVQIGSQSTRIISFDSIEDFYEIENTVELASGGNILEVPALTYAFTRPSGDQALLSKPLLLDDDVTLTGVHALYAVSEPGSDLPVEVAGNRLEPGQIVKIVEAYDFDANEGRINVPVRPLSEQEGSVRIQVATSVDRAPKMDITVSTWSESAQLQSDTWTIRQLIDRVDIGATATQGARCHLITDEAVAKSLDVFVEPACLLEWTSRPPETQKANAPSGADMPFANLVGEVVDEGTHKVGYTLYVVDANGQKVKMATGQRDLVVTSIVQTATFAPMDDMSEVIQVIDPVEMDLYQTSGPISCLLSGDEADVIRQTPMYSGSGRRPCLLQWVRYPDDLSVSQGSQGAPYLYGDLNEEGEHVVSWQVSMFSEAGEKVVIAEQDYTITAVRPMEPQIRINTNYRQFNNGVYAVPLDAFTFGTAEVQGEAAEIEIEVSTTFSETEVDRFSPRMWGRNVVAKRLFSPPDPGTELWETHTSRLDARYSLMHHINTVVELDYLVVPSSRVYPVIEMGEGEVINTGTVPITVQIREIGNDGYDPSRMGVWEVRLARGNFRTDNEPLTDFIPTTDGAVRFDLDVSQLVGTTRVVAEARVVSPVPGYERIDVSPALMLTVLHGGEIEGELVANRISGPEPLSTVVMLQNSSIDQRRAAGEVQWQVSQDGGASWDTQEPDAMNMFRFRNTFSAGTYLVRAKTINRHTDVEFLSESVEIVAYEVPNVTVEGPEAVFVGEEVELRAIVTDQDGGVLTDAQVIWEDSRAREVIGEGMILRLNSEEARTYMLQAKARVAYAPEDDRRAYATHRKRVQFVNMEPLRVNLSGPTRVEKGKEYSYSVRRILPNRYMDHELEGYFITPTGEQVTGDELIYIPTEEDVQNERISIQYIGWVEGYKQETQGSAERTSFVWAYAWPNFWIRTRENSAYAPIDVTAEIRQSRNVSLDDPVYEWTVPEENIESLIETNMLRRFIVEEPGTYKLEAKISDSRGNESEVEATLTALLRPDYEMDIRVIGRNRYDRAPQEVSIRGLVHGGHPRDRVTDYSYKVNGIDVQALSGRGQAVLDAGINTIEATATTAYGETVTAQTEYEVFENQPPECRLEYTEGNVTWYIIARCHDPDGFVTGYQWWVDGEESDITTRRLSLRKSDYDGQLPDIEFIGTDDAGVETDVITQLEAR